MIPRTTYEDRVKAALARSPITAILGPRQCGKTTLARSIGAIQPAEFFDLESEADRSRLSNPELALGPLSELAIIDEIQQLPKLFAALRILVDRDRRPGRFLILGSASPDVVRGVSESLAGRVEFIDLSGFDLSEVGVDAANRLWIRGGFPRSFLAETEEDCVAWRDGFIRTFLERDIPQLGVSIPAAAMRRFWTMLGHFHGQTWNASRLAQSMGVSDKTVRHYLDLLTGTFMVRQLQPWYSNTSKRQVKAPKIYLRDTGILHHLLVLPDERAVTGHPSLGASWEGFVIEQVLQVLRPPEAFFWATYQGAELDLLLFHRGQPFGIEVKYSEAPKITRSMRTAMSTLNLKHLWVCYPGTKTYLLDESITTLPLKAIPTLQSEIARLATGS
jgi:hypothetical protein